MHKEISRNHIEAVLHTDFSTVTSAMCDAGTLTEITTEITSSFANKQYLVCH